jgi:hypothetical protein
VDGRRASAACQACQSTWALVSSELGECGEGRRTHSVQLLVRPGSPEQTAAANVLIHVGSGREPRIRTDLMLATRMPRASTALQTAIEPRR